ncbi:hypothetical protein E2C01_081773 [Portunus trituberculatus]|uniref:Uncharacterized protein n=1 Tax=Portunus trituberculatus TaxID=210409 RepID=A0A5B7IQN5_PORTR|nr:hypothetical protein [Portunus trituberculatus]
MIPVRISPLLCVQHRWVSDKETLIIPGKNSIVPPQVPPTGKGETLEAFPR